MVLLETDGAEGAPVRLHGDMRVRLTQHAPALDSVVATTLCAHTARELNARDLASTADEARVLVERAIAVFAGVADQTCLVLLESFIGIVI